PGAGQRERRVRVEALEAAGARRAAHAAGELRPELLLLGMRAREAGAEVGVELGGVRPALDAAGGLEPRDRRGEMAAREPELGRERFAALVERRLLDDGGGAVRAAHRHPAEGARLPAELPLDDREVVVHLRRG